jgi:hypothetical protein
MSALIVSKKKQELLDSMNDVTKEIASKIEQKILAAGKVGVLLYHDIGSSIDILYKSEGLDDAAKRAEMNKLANYLGKDGFSLTQLTDYRNVALAFRREYLVQQVEQPMSDGKLLSFSHFHQLQKISNEAKREALLVKIRKEAMSARELGVEISSKGDAEIKRNGGRKPGIPKSPNAMLQKLINSTQQTDNYLQEMLSPFVAAVDEIEDGNFDAEFVENLDNALARISETEKTLLETRDKLKKARSRAPKKAEPVATAAKKAKG